MKQVVQDVRTGKQRVVEVPPPMVKPGHVLIANAFSLISAGTEKAAIELARKSLLGKARARPDQVRRVVEKIRQEGIFNALEQVARKLDEPMTLGYCSAGIVLAAGAGVQEFKPGDRVASNGPHAGVVCVPRHLCARVPDNVPLDHAAVAVLGAIAMHGMRLAQLDLGGCAAVIGLGLVGQLAVALLKAQGCKVLATDPDLARCAVARLMGADIAEPDMPVSLVMDHTGGFGADAVLIAAATTSDQPVQRAIEYVRKKGRIVAMGAVGMNLPRRPFYFKEAEFVVSCSYGPGRYDSEYEERGRDYPFAYVRWTEQRNLQAVLDLMGAKRLNVAPLLTRRFPIENAEEAYRALETESPLGILLEYSPSDAHATAVRTVALNAASVSGALGIGVIGAGQFARSMLIPTLAQQSDIRLRAICSAGGLSAAHTGQRYGFEIATTAPEEVWNDPAVQLVVIATRHNLHAEQVLAALRAGKHVFVEKPLCLALEDLEAIEQTLREAESSGKPRLLMVGFNRRFAPASRAVRSFFAQVAAPLAVHIRFNAGALPPDHWTQAESEGGGRLVGEACHGIDLATYLTGSLPIRVFAESVGGAAGVTHDDQAFITLRHANGSISCIAYWAGGDRALPKERVEVAGGGRMAIIDDFCSVTQATDGRVRTKHMSRQDKGHAVELDEFVATLKQGGTSPIGWDEIRAVTRASLLAARSLREGIPFDV
jgi:predicted dehydrogenase/threonine dehydrogenase-like Zn-dependent dehydrogenase